MAGHGLVFVLLNVATIRVAVCGERGLCPPFGDLLNGAERWFGSGNA